MTTLIGYRDSPRVHASSDVERSRARTIGLLSTPRRRWSSATSMLKKYGIMRLRVERSGCSMTTKPGRRFRSPSWI